LIEGFILGLIIGLLILVVIKRGPKYNELDKLCKKFKFTEKDLEDVIVEKKKKKILTKQLNNKLCKLWKQDKIINPITNRKIKKNGPTYKEINKKCIQ